MVAVPVKTLLRSGTKTFPFQTFGLTSRKSLNSSVPTKFGVPPRAESALALAFAQTTVPHRLFPHGWTRTCTLFEGLRQTLSLPTVWAAAAAGKKNETAAAKGIRCLRNVLIWTPPVSLSLTPNSWRAETATERRIARARGGAARCHRTGA